MNCNIDMQPTERKVAVQSPARIPRRVEREISKGPGRPSCLPLIWSLADSPGWFNSSRGSLSDIESKLESSSSEISKGFEISKVQKVDNWLCLWEEAENRGWSVHTRLHEQMPIRQATAHQISDRTCVSADANTLIDYRSSRAGK